MAGTARRGGGRATRMHGRWRGNYGCGIGATTCTRRAMDSGLTACHAISVSGSADHGAVGRWALDLGAAGRRGALPAGGTDPLVDHQRSACRMMRRSSCTAKMLTSTGGRGSRDTKPPSRRMRSSIITSVRRRAGHSHPIIVGRNMLAVLVKDVPATLIRRYWRADARRARRFAGESVAPYPRACRTCAAARAMRDRADDPRLAPSTTNHPATAHAEIVRARTRCSMRRNANMRESASTVSAGQARRGQ